MCLSAGWVLVSPPGQGWDPGLGEGQRLFWRCAYVFGVWGLPFWGQVGPFLKPHGCTSVPRWWKGHMAEGRAPGTPRTWPLGLLPASLYLEPAVTPRLASMLLPEGLCHPGPLVWGLGCTLPPQRREVPVLTSAPGWVWVSPQLRGAPCAGALAWDGSGRVPGPARVCTCVPECMRECAHVCVQVCACVRCVRERQTVERVWRETEWPSPSPSPSPRHPE